MNPRPHPTSRTAQARRGRGRTAIGGFSLVEVMVSLIIIAVGMLGLAKIQALAFASTGIAGEQSLAAMQAASLAAAMHTNRSYWSTVPSGFSFQSTGPVMNSPTDPTLSGTLPACRFVAGNPPCSPAQIAAYDLQTWVTSLGKILLNPSAAVACQAPAGSQLDCTITIGWTESNVDINAQSQGYTMAQPSYTLYVIP